MNHKIVFRFLVILISFSPGLILGQVNTTEANLVKMGASQINITPDKPTLLSGYSDRNTPFTGVHDSIHASALYFTGQNTKALLISADIVDFYSGLDNDLKKMISSKTGIPSDNIFIIAVHNHSGPSISVYEKYDYPEILKQKLVRISMEAMKNLRPFTMALGRGSCNLNISRRAQNGDGNIWLGKNPDGACDHELDAVKFETLDKKTIAVLLNWPCHATIGGGDNMQISGDWPGTVASYIKKQEGKDVVVFVTAGASADINPIYSPGDKWFQDIETVGFHLGVEALKSLKQAEMYPVKILQTTNAALIFPGKKPGKINFDQKVPIYQKESEREIKLSMLKIGDIVLAGISGELMTEIGMEIKKQSPYTSTLIVTHCNGASGYICTDKSFSEGGYEVQVSRFMPGVEKPLTNKFLELIHSF